MAYVIYARFSPRKRAEESTSIDTQLEICRDYAKKKGKRILHEYHDAAASGADAERPGLWDAVEALRKNDVLLVHRLDRLARGVFLAEFIRSKVKHKKASIESVEGHYDDADPEACLIRQVLQAVSEYERKIISARTSTYMRRMQRNGRRVGGKIPFGFERSEDGSMLVPIDDQHRQIMLMCEMWEAGMNIYPISDEMLRLKERNPNSKTGKFCYRTIRNIIKREGFNVDDGERTTDDTARWVTSPDKPYLTAMREKRRSLGPKSKFALKMEARKRADRFLP